MRVHIPCFQENTHSRMGDMRSYIRRFCADNLCKIFFTSVFYKPDDYFFTALILYTLSEYYC